jgi:putative acetyltransferase
MVKNFTRKFSNNMIRFREILPGDNAAIAEIVRNSMMEFNADPKTTVLGDPSLNTMYENCRQPRSVFFVAVLDEKIVGGSGVKQLDGSAENICELQRMFLTPAARGKGIGKKLMEMCLAKAKEFGYEKMYLESLPQMKSAIALYKKSGFTEIGHALGDTRHKGCSVWMIRELQ